MVKKYNREISFVLPLTSSLKNNKYYYNLKKGDSRGSIILSQGRLLSSKRFLRRIKKLNDNDFNEIKRRIFEIML